MESPIVNGESWTLQFRRAPIDRQLAYRRTGRDRPIGRFVLTIIY